MKLNKALKIIIACGGFLFVCFFISFKAHAESSTNLPYNVNNELPFDYSYYVELYNSTWSDYPCNWDSPLVIAFYNDYVDENNYFLYFLVPYVNNPNYSLSLNGVPYADFNVEEDYITLSQFTNSFYYISFQMRNGNLTAYGFSNSDSINFLGSYAQPIFLNGGSYNWGEFPVLYVYIESVVITGHATAPTFGGGSGVNGSDFLGTGADFGASLSQATMPQAPTYNTFNFSTFNPPTFDDSSILDALDSIAQILIYTGNYLVSNILGAFSTLMGNIIKIGEYIVGVLEYIGRSIITNIQNAVQNLYENIVSLFQPLFDLVSVIREKIDYITEPFDKDEFFHQVDGNHLITACIHIEDSGEQMKSILTNAQERNTFHLNITYPKPDGTNFQTMISFDWLYPLRHLYMPYLWVFTILYLFFSACRLLGNVIGGKS